jgi:hypothetical protein
MSVTTDIGKKVWTEAELEALPEDGFMHEVVIGELVMSPKNNFPHENICMRLSFALEAFNREHKLSNCRSVQELGLGVSLHVS